MVYVQVACEPQALIEQSSLIMEPRACGGKSINLGTFGGRPMAVRTGHRAAVVRRLGVGQLHRHKECSCRPYTMSLALRTKFAASGCQPMRWSSVIERGDQCLCSRLATRNEFEVRVETRVKDKCFAPPARCGVADSLVRFRACSRLEEMQCRSRRVPSGWLTMSDY
jgi:hypothetical protein